VAPLLAGLQASQKIYGALGERALAVRSGAAALRLRTIVGERFADGWERFGSGGRPEISAHWMDWLNDHRTPWGSLPEKVLATGATAGSAPLAWTAARVVLTTAELETHEPSPNRALLPGVGGSVSGLSTAESA